MCVKMPISDDLQTTQKDWQDYVECPQAGLYLRATRLDCDCLDYLIERLQEIRPESIAAVTPESEETNTAATETCNAHDGVISPARNHRGALATADVISSKEKTEMPSNFWARLLKRSLMGRGQGNKKESAARRAAFRPTKLVIARCMIDFNNAVDSTRTRDKFGQFLRLLRSSLESFWLECRGAPNNLPQRGNATVNNKDLPQLQAAFLQFLTEDSSTGPAEEEESTASLEETGKPQGFVCLREIHLAGVRFMSDEQDRALLYNLMTNQNLMALTRLKFVSCLLNHHAIVGLAGGIRHCPNRLKSLALHQCVLTDALLGDLATVALTTPTSLVALSLVANHLSPAALEFLDWILQRQPQLQTLDMSSNIQLWNVHPPPNLEDEEASILWEAYTRHERAFLHTLRHDAPSLTKLSLSNVGLTDESASQLLHALHGKTPLETLHLNGNPLDGRTTLPEKPGYLHHLTFVEGLRHLSLPNSYEVWQDRVALYEEANGGWRWCHDERGGLMAALESNTSLLSCTCRHWNQPRVNELLGRNRILHNVAQTTSQLPLACWPRVIAQLYDKSQEPVGQDSNSAKEATTCLETTTSSTIRYQFVQSTQMEWTRGRS